MTDWIRLMDADTLPENAAVTVSVDGREWAVYIVAGEAFVSDPMCTHGEARLCDGYLIGHEIECPLHQGRFDVRSGEPTWSPACEPLTTYGTKTKDGVIWLWPEPNV